MRRRPRSSDKQAHHWLPEVLVRMRARLFVKGSFAFHHDYSWDAENRTNRLPEKTLVVEQPLLCSERKPHGQQGIVIERMEMCHRDLNTTAYRKSKPSPQVEFPQQQSGG